MKTPRVQVRPKAVALPVFEAVVANMNASVLGVVTIRFVAPMTEMAKAMRVVTLIDTQFSVILDDSITVQRCWYDKVTVDKGGETTITIKAEVPSAAMFMAKYPSLIDATVELKFQQTGEKAA